MVEEALVGRQSHQRQGRRLWWWSAYVSGTATGSMATAALRQTHLLHAEAWWCQSQVAFRQAVVQRSTTATHKTCVATSSSAEAYSHEEVREGPGVHL
jgi:hypothetical protein